MPDPKEKSKLPVTVTKPTPYTFDLGLLLANDPNPLLLQSNLEDDLSTTARDGAQALLNQLLSTCPITSTPSGVLLSLPPISTPLPREKVPSHPPSNFQHKLSFQIFAKPLLTYHFTAPAAPQSRYDLGALRAQKGHKSQDFGRPAKDAIRRGHGRMGSEVGV